MLRADDCVCDLRASRLPRFSLWRFRRARSPISHPRSAAPAANAFAHPNTRAARLQLLGLVIGAFGGVFFGLSGAKSPYSGFLVAYGGVLFVLNGFATLVRHHLTCRGQDCCVLDGGASGGRCNCYAAFQRWVYSLMTIVLAAMSALLALLLYTGAISKALEEDLGKDDKTGLVHAMITSKGLAYLLMGVTAIQVLAVVLACTSASFKAESSYKPLKQRDAKRAQDAMARKQRKQEEEASKYTGEHASMHRLYDNFKPARLQKEKKFQFRNLFGGRSSV